MLTLKIVSPERVEFDGNVISVKVPGTMGSFEVLDNHAPSLEKGVVEYTTTDKEKRQLNIFGGFVEVQKNVVSLCVELYDNE